MELFEAHSRDARVILPLLKTLDILVAHRCLDDLIVDSSSPFRRTVLQFLTKEAKNCGDIHRLFACIDVAIGFVSATTSSEEGDVSEEVANVVCSQFEKQKISQLVFVILKQNYNFTR